MKILLASSSSGSRGGGELYLLYLGRALSELGHEVSLWSSLHSRMDELCNLFASIGRVHRSHYTNLYDRKLRTISAYLDRRTPARLARVWSEIPHDILHLNKQNLEDGLEMLRAARRLPAPSVCTIHLTQSARYLGAKSHLVRDQLARRALTRYPGELITVLAERSRNLADFLHRSDRITTIPNGVPLLSRDRLAYDRIHIRRSLDLAPEQPLFVAVGRMVPQKRPLIFLEVARKIAETLPEARFLWVGDGPMAGEWDQKTTDFPAVRRLPWQTHVTPYLAAADAFIHVAQYEGLPLAILEAMAAGLPCIITPNLEEELEFLTPETSLIARRESSDWLQLLQIPEELRQRGEAARAVIESEYSYLKMAERCLAVYEKALSSKGA